MLNIGLMNELKHEASTTIKLLERIPIEKLEWRPHEKSSTLGGLSLHVARIPAIANIILTTPEYDITNPMFSKYQPFTKEELLETFNNGVNATLKALENTSMAKLDEVWKFRMGEKVLMELPRKAAIRNLSYNHFVHHRGQLSVYLRLLDVPLPGIYGPSADDRMM
ncbi:MAG: hypothetical protein RJA07_83 [Bacteroidota bacterium]|jgi:uncharacterized damage-inducible protein DinB